MPPPMIPMNAAMWTSLLVVCLGGGFAESRFLRGLEEQVVCLTEERCRREFKKMDLGGFLYVSDRWSTKGCFYKNSNGYFGAGGTVEEMSDPNLPGKQRRIWCDPETDSPTAGPTRRPATESPTELPTSQPSGGPTERPTSAPSTGKPTAVPTRRPVTDSPTEMPTSQPSHSPTERPTSAPPSRRPTTYSPSEEPTAKPTQRPPSPSSTSVSSSPTEQPSHKPVIDRPSKQPAPKPGTKMPTEEQPPYQTTEHPTTKIPTRKPTQDPTAQMLLAHISKREPDDGQVSNEVLGNISKTKQTVKPAAEGPTTTSSTEANVGTDSDSSNTVGTLTESSTASPSYGSSMATTVDPTILASCPPAYDPSKTSYVAGELTEVRGNVFLCHEDEVDEEGGVLATYEKYCNIAEWHDAPLDESEDAKPMWDKAWVLVGQCEEKPKEQEGVKDIAPVVEQNPTDHIPIEQSVVDELEGGHVEVHGTGEVSGNPTDGPSTQISAADSNSTPIEGPTKRGDSAHNASEDDGSSTMMQGTLEPTPSPNLALSPTTNPTFPPTVDPLKQPTEEPTTQPTEEPTFSPTFSPTANPTFLSTTFSPSGTPTASTSLSPSTVPSSFSSKFRVGASVNNGEQSIIQQALPKGELSATTASPTTDMLPRDIIWPEESSGTPSQSPKGEKNRVTPPSLPLETSSPIAIGTNASVKNQGKPSKIADSPGEMTATAPPPAPLETSSPIVFDDNAFTNSQGKPANIPQPVATESPNTDMQAPREINGPEEAFASPADKTNSRTNIPVTTFGTFSPSSTSGPPTIAPNTTYGQPLSTDADSETIVSTPTSQTHKFHSPTMAPLRPPELMTGSTHNSISDLTNAFSPSSTTNNTSNSTPNLTVNLASDSASTDSTPNSTAFNLMLYPPMFNSTSNSTSDLFASNSTIKSTSDLLMSNSTSNSAPDGTSVDMVSSPMTTALSTETDSDGGNGEKDQESREQKSKPQGGKKQDDKKNEATKDEKQKEEKKESGKKEEDGKEGKGRGKEDKKGKDEGDKKQHDGKKGDKIEGEESKDSERGGLVTMDEELVENESYLGSPISQEDKSSKSTRILVLVVVFIVGTLLVALYAFRARRRANAERGDGDGTFPTTDDPSAVPVSSVAICTGDWGEQSNDPGGEGSPTDEEENNEIVGHRRTVDFSLPVETFPLPSNSLADSSVAPSDFGDASTVVPSNHSSTPSFTQKSSLSLWPRYSNMDPTQDSTIDSTRGSTIDSTQGSMIDSTIGSTIDSTRGSTMPSSDDSLEGTNATKGAKSGAGSPTVSSIAGDPNESRCFDCI